MTVKDISEDTAIPQNQVRTIPSRLKGKVVKFAGDEWGAAAKVGEVR